MTSTESQAFVLRMTLEGIDQLREALDQGVVTIGWSRAAGLMDATLDWDAFREVVHGLYYADDGNYRRSGAAAAHLWRFIREMQVGDLVVVPARSGFFVGRVSGNATYAREFVEQDTAFRRAVNWLNDRRPIPRSHARAALQSRMKVQGTTAYATDLLDEIQECLELSLNGESPTFMGDLRTRLLNAALAEIRSGRLDSYGFEKLVQDVLISLGAEEARIVGRRVDKGADLVATFPVAGVFQLVIAVQAKHWQPEPAVPADVVADLIRGIKAEGASVGMLVTSGTISGEAIALADDHFAREGVRIELVDGEHLAAMVVDGGLGSGLRA